MPKKAEIYKIVAYFAPRCTTRPTLWLHMWRLHLAHGSSQVYIGLVIHCDGPQPIPLRDKLSPNVKLFRIVCRSLGDSSSTSS